MGQKPFMQTTLDTFVVSPRTIILAPTVNGRKTFGHLFLELPPEIRCMIYPIVFHDAVLKIDYGKLQVPSSGRKSSRQTISIPKMLKMVQDNKAALLRAFEYFEGEGLYILASCTTIDIRSSHSERDDILAAIDKTFLQYIPRIHINPDAFIRANRNLISGVREVTLTFLTNQFSDPYDLHPFLCPACGPFNREYIYGEFLLEIDDWDWKRQQLCHLAKENNWKIKLVICAVLPAPIGDPIFKAQLEFEFDLDSEELISEQWVVQNEATVLNTDFINSERYKEINKLLRSKYEGPYDSEDD